MRFHGVYLLCCVVKLDGFGVLVADVSGLLVLVYMLRGALLSVIFQEFILFFRVLVARQQACLFQTVRLILGCTASFLLQFQRGPAWGMTARRILLPFSYFQNFHVQLLPIDYSFKVLLICILPPRFPCSGTSCMSPCRNFLQNIIPLCRLFLFTSWGRRGGESC